MIRIGLVGAGRIARVHARTVEAHLNAELVFIADPVEDAVKPLAEKYGVRYSLNPDDVFTDPAVDAVIICSPTPLHVDHILKAAKAGKPALCEKPVAMETETVTQLMAELEGIEHTTMLGFNRRFDPTFARMHKLVDEGVVGKVEQVTIISRDPAAPPKEYIAVSGGIFKDMTIHDFDTARFFLGDITSVYVVGQNLDPELADTGDFDAAVITLTNSDGATATITNSRHCSSGYDQRLEVFGDKATLNGENMRSHQVRVSNGEYTDAKDVYLDFFLERYEEAYAIELNEFFAAIAENRKPATSIEDGAKALRIAEAAEESAHTGKIVYL
ncbi:inositol 2-dehydrogenase [Arcanobacterium haemolyticum]|uniref:Oxidoreductase domain protein n=1 Tax=Arcanobacterium haemolyticum (strain ATCC 9345 / DSM 20595 / CCM 5947 / CCUG 17215 / LMG 16163 / NBRC 15585 / NCTC 8452 / 11018) TaxID=644284 RepID=D7BLL0_ARCHD|nr:inositol 2-dehydrogenase [Arcanobacterium haemolyticum]ADH91809.1 oxidoreductase domain protein [Arcanobacterium haemolyticum DSM 20595]SQH27358.1 Inositol 2-dehydrogenase [Arcanobacterium haemolyticum]